MVLPNGKTTPHEDVDNSESLTSVACLNSPLLVEIAELLYTGRSRDEIVVELASSSQYTASHVEHYVDCMFNTSLGRVLLLENKRTEKMVGLLKLLYTYWVASDHAASIDQTEPPGKKEFLNEYYLTNRPLIVRDGAHAWPAVSLWTNEYLTEKYGHVTIEYMAGSARDYGQISQVESVKRNMPLGAFLERCNSLVSSNDFYMVATNFNLKSAALSPLIEDICRPNLYPLEDQTWKQRARLWIGPRGTVTPLHHDRMNSIFVQVRGKKRWRMLPSVSLPLMHNHAVTFSEFDASHEWPDHDNHAPSPYLDFVLNPGDILFVPVGWWHWVYSMEQSISVNFIGFPDMGAPDEWSDSALPSRFKAHR
jgi:hypothetical protein